MSQLCTRSSFSVDGVMHHCTATLATYKKAWKNRFDIHRSLWFVLDLDHCVLHLVPLFSTYCLDFIFMFNFSQKITFYSYENVVGENPALSTSNSLKRQMRSWE